LILASWTSWERCKTLITLLEIDGFKTFQDFKLALSPFQVIVGPNGAGKSNLFDALHLLSRLVDTDLRSAFQELRGDAKELFTTMPNGKSLNRMFLAVEMLVDRSIQDSWGAKADLKYTRMRYELKILRRLDEQGLERLYVAHESLKAIPRSDDDWCKKHGLSTQNGWLPKLTGGRPHFISTEETKTGQNTIHLHQDSHGGRKSSVAEKIERTVLSGVTNTEFPHAFAAKEEIPQRRRRFDFSTRQEALARRINLDTLASVPSYTEFVNELRSILTALNFI